MGSVNKVILVGRLGADPELKYGSTGKAFCNMSLATTESWKDKGGSKQEKTEWHRIVSFGDTAENVAKFMKKGSECFVEGKIQTRQYEKDGQKHYATDILADRVVFLGKGDGSSGRQQDRGATDPDPTADDGDLPF